MRIEPFALERWMTTWELLVTHDIAESGFTPLSIAEMLRLAGVADPTSMIAELAEAPQLYSEARGTEALRSTIAATYTDTTAEGVLVTTGAIEANYLVCSVLLSPGDHAVVTTPCYQQLESVPRAIGADVTPWPVDTSSGFRFDLDMLESLVTDRTKLIVINSPHNPTGALLRRADLDRIVAIADRVGAWILSDEAYRWIEHPGGEPLPPPMRDLYPRSVSVGTMSKFFGMPGLRLGWLASTPEIAADAWAQRDYTSLSPAWLSDRLACIAIEHRDAIKRRNDAILAANLDTAEAWFAANRDIVRWHEPPAGLLTMIDIVGVDDTDELAERLASEASVMLAPGSTFGLPGHLRIGLGQKPEVFREGLDRAGAFIRHYRGLGDAAV